MERPGDGGPVTNLSACLCSDAQSGQILVSNHLLLTVQPLVEAEWVGELTLKGCRQPITAYHIRGLSASPRSHPALVSPHPE